jgi:hypothetical protein
MNFSLSWHDKLELTESVIIKRTNVQYGNSSFKDQNLRGFANSLELVIRIPVDFVWETTLDYNSPLHQMGTPDKQFVRWNAAVNYFFLKNKKAQLKFMAYDILRMNAGFSSYASENYYSETERNVLTNYYLLTFTYNLRDFRSGKVGGRGLFRF